MQWIYLHCVIICEFWVHVGQLTNGWQVEDSKVRYFALFQADFFSAGICYSLLLDFCLSIK